MHIAIQVCVPPYTYEDLDTAIHLAESLLNKGHKVSIFLFADSVLSVNSKVKPMKIDRNIPEKMKELVEKGIEVHICGICAEYRGLTSENTVPGPKFSGVPEMASLIANADRFISLMP